jgi:hypothetical protein
VEKKERIVLDRLDVCPSETPTNSHFSSGVLPFSAIIETLRNAVTSTRSTSLHRECSAFIAFFIIIWKACNWSLFGFQQAFG